MKKITLILMACAMVALSSCGNKKKSAAQDSAANQESFETQQLELYLQAQLDSIASIYLSKANNPVVAAIKSGNVELTESEKSIKPAYLINPDQTAGLVSLAQKYRALPMLFIDKQIAEWYGMSVDGYKAAAGKLVSDINDPAIKQLNAVSSNINDEANKQLYLDLYADEVKNGRICLFWELNGAILIETLYIMSQNIDKFTVGMTDDDAANLTYRLFLAKNSVDQLTAYYPELESLSKSLAPLDVLNAMDMAELKTQLSEMKGQLEIIRNSLLN
ncbi:MAG: hypothetical protein MJY58_06510 [Bacteroidaceae bacterium]|nr:hypothetical protein [Bacteroidaceae bacterium]